MIALLAIRRRFAPRAKNIAHFDVDSAEIGKVKRVNWHHVGVLETDLNDMLEYGRRIKFAKTFDVWHEEIAGLKKEYAMNYDRDSELIQPYAVIEEINKHTKGEAIISTGVGQHQMWAAQYFDFREAATLADVRQHGNNGLRLACCDRRSVRST